MGRLGCCSGDFGGFNWSVLLFFVYVFEIVNSVVCWLLDD